MLVVKMFLIKLIVLIVMLFQIHYIKILHVVNTNVLLLFKNMVLVLVLLVVI